MKRLHFLAVLVLNLMLIPAGAQQALFGGEDIISPEIREDNSVTFRIKAENATEVRVTGDWMPAQGWTPGSELMVKDDKGIWTHTTRVLEPELYSYSFTVDGLRVNDPNNAFLSRDIATNTNIFIIGGGQADLYRVNEVPHGSVTRRWYESPGLEMTRRLTIYTPPGYETSGKEYPVLYLLHGAGGDEEAWIELGRSAQIMDNLIATGKAEPMIVVMPNGNVSQEAAPGEGSKGYYKPQFMYPGTMNGAYEEHFMDIVNFVDAAYRVKANKAHRAIAGLSMGGFHSIHISRFHPNTFDYIGPFSAAVLPRDESSSPVYTNLDATWKAQVENGFKLYWMGCGKDDFLYQANAEFRAKLDEMGFEYTYRESEGGHIWKNWRIYLSEFVPLLFR